MKKASLIRVTTVLSFLDSHWLQFWYKSVGIEEAERISKESASFGTGVHKLVEEYLTQGIEKVDTIVTTNARQLECAGHIINWLKEIKAKPLHVEPKLEDKKLGLCGHADLIAEIDGNIWVIDYKTSKKVSLTYPLQLSAYAAMASKQFGLKINNGAIVRVPNDPKADPQFEVTQYNGLSKWWAMFKKFLDVYKYLNGKVRI
jgi:hypothetical protein